MTTATAADNNGENGITVETDTNDETGAVSEKESKTDEKKNGKEDGDAKVEDFDEEDDPPSNDTKDDDKAEGKQESKTPTSKPPPFTTTNTQLLGHIEGLSTNNPVFKLPFPNGGSLVFAGKKIDSSSRFHDAVLSSGQCDL